MGKFEWADNFQKKQGSDKGKSGKSYVGVKINPDGTYDYSHALEIRGVESNKVLNEYVEEKQSKFEKQLQSSGALEQGNARAVWYSMQENIKRNKEILNKAKESGKSDTRLEKRIEEHEMQQKIFEDIINRFAQDLIVKSIDTNESFTSEKAEEIANNITADEMLGIVRTYVEVYDKKVLEYKNGNKNNIGSDDKEYEKLKTMLRAANNLESQLLNESLRIEDFDERLDRIEEKTNKNEQLSINEIRLLYDLDRRYQLYPKDPARYDQKEDTVIANRKWRIGNIIEDRNPIVDLSRITGYKEEQISSTVLACRALNYQDKNVGADGVQIHCGDIYRGFDLPQKKVIGNIRLDDYILSREEINFPEEEVTGTLQLKAGIIEGSIKFPKKVGALFIDNIETSEQLIILPEEVRSSLFLSNLKFAKNIKFPKKVGGNIFLGSLTSVDGLELPEKVGGIVELPSLPDDEKEQLKLKYPNLKFELPE